MELSNFWITVILIILAGHFIWFIIYAIKQLKSSPGNNNPENNEDSKPT